MQIANRLAGFSLGDADMLRRAMGKKKPEEMAAQREKFLTGCAARQGSAEKGREDFRSDGGICGLRLQQVALLRVRAAGVSDGMAENALSRRIHGGDAHVGNGQHRKSGEVHQRSAQHGHHRPAAGCEFERCGLHSGGRPDSLRAVRHQERWREHGEGHSGRARNARAVHWFLRILRVRGYAAAQQARA